MNTKDNLNLALQEVIDFHQNIALWFNGSATDKEELYHLIISKFSTSFSMTNGDNKTINFDAFCEWLPSSYACSPNISVNVQDIKGYSTVHHVLIEYIETQQSDIKNTIRKSSAVFLIENKQAKWLHLKETWLQNRNIIH